MAFTSATSISAPARNHDEFLKWHRAASGIDSSVDAENENGNGGGNGNENGTAAQNGAGRRDEHASSSVDAAQLTMPRTSHYRAKGSIPNTLLAVSFISAVLGAVVGIAGSGAARPLVDALGGASWSWARPQFGIYIAAIALFHLLEFWTTAGWNFKKVSVDAFLINNGKEYHLAHAFGITEYLLASYLWPSKFSYAYASPYVAAGAVVFMIIGQTFRSLAMVQCGDSFSHIVKKVKLDDHTLVTNGLYAWCRHPSYVGFFMWAIATQVLMSNVVAPILYLRILHQFFSNRIPEEEVHLVRFYGDAYLEYRKKVGTGFFWIK